MGPRVLYRCSSKEWSGGRLAVKYLLAQCFLARLESRPDDHHHEQTAGDDEQTCHLNFGQKSLQVIGRKGQ